ncbi:NADH-quinone oxidoreductase subunit NuoH [Pedosphaera parvula]|uniref:NADH-quinone oxidoreductase subunit H n=1 Tax=Pedosphaera parvula (strain Ellin514) TaxID=320771 RepID=B9XFX6_PEDPL|nr:NADH-quinone oxidoreductase subunit NuoH [Pedosphaera parvula]EEF61138.1 NADH dehydrogenase (quinone) [Pedosphaera parvula Ellin514]
MIGDFFRGLFLMIWKVVSDQPDSKAEFLSVFPDVLQPLISVLLSIVPIILVFAGLFALTTWLERKVLGRIQNRLGPNRVGPVGLFQPVADGLKMLTKEDIVPHSADKVVHFLAPVVLLVPTLLAYAVLPIGRNMVPINLDAGILFFFAVGASTELSVFMAGWSSRNKYSLLGAMRAIAQMISYEIPLILSSVSVIMIVGSLSLVDIVEKQGGYHFHFLPRWFVFTPWGFAGFIIFLISSLAESNRSPFDIPEAESEIIAGHLTEYSGFKYALFFLAEYLGMFAVSGLGVTLFLGGWHAPLPFLEGWLSYIWFFLKLLALVFVFIWIRGTLPRLRVDQLLNFAWKFLLPMSLINLFVAAIWHFTSGWDTVAGGVGRWILCAAMIAIPYIWLGRSLVGQKKVTHRTYRFAS